MTEAANKVHCSTIAEFNEMLGLPRPEHPLISVCFKDEMRADQEQLCAMGAPGGFTYSNDFYTVAIKKVVTGDLYYGRTKYDFSNGTMMFTGPRQEITCSDVVCSVDVLLIAVHEDFLRGHPLWNTVRKYGFFSYAVNEALHLSPKEEALVRSIARNILDEYTDNPDEFSRELLLSQLDTLLKYANRYYKRQFINRAELSDAIVGQFDEAIRAYFDAGRMATEGLPRIDDIADVLAVSPRYLSDTLKASTGKSAQEHIHLYLMDEAKNLLLQPESTVAGVAYDLGFEYPQYFSRLFKKKTGVSPKAYRDQHAVN